MPALKELVITGRYADPMVLEKADLVTETREIDQAVDFKLRAARKEGSHGVNLTVDPVRRQRQIWARGERAPANAAFIHGELD